MSSTVATLVAPWEYRDISVPVPSQEPIRLEELPQRAAAEPPRFTEEEIKERIRHELTRAQAEWEAQAQAEQEKREDHLRRELNSFAQQRTAYFRGVESDVVQLTLAITEKILLREAALDPALLSGLVRVALDRLGAETPARLRVPLLALEAWQRCALRAGSSHALDLVGDPTLEEGACHLECNAGAVDLNLRTQLKEIETAFQDLLRKRPEPMQ